MKRKDSQVSLDPFADILGVDFPPERLAENLRAFRDILHALRTLRQLDLTDVHPAIVFDPKAGYPQRSGR